MKSSSKRNRNQLGFMNLKNALLTAGVSVTALTLGITAYSGMNNFGISENLGSSSLKGVCVTAALVEDLSVKNHYGYCGAEDNSENPEIPSEPTEIPAEPTIPPVETAPPTTPTETTPPVEPTNPPNPVIDPEAIMITTWDTSLASNCRQITLPVERNIAGTVKWGPDTEPVDLKVYPNISPAFSAPYGEIKITINGTFDKWGNDGFWEDANCLVSVDRWGETNTKDLRNAFAKAHNLRSVKAIPSTTTDLYRAFYFSDANPILGEWNTANVTDMTSTFSNAKNFNQDISKWNTSNVTIMSHTFGSASKFNQDISGWDTSKVKLMTGLFGYATKFNQPVWNWNTSNVTDMTSVFTNATSFNQPLIDPNGSGKGWDTSSVTNMNYMFEGASSFNQELSHFNISKVSQVYAMFRNATSFNKNLSNWSLSKISSSNKRLFADGATSWIAEYKPKL